jgi:hypothetical protein
MTYTAKSLWTSLQAFESNWFTSIFPIYLAISVLVFFLLSFVRTPYGRYSNKVFGFLIPAKVCDVIPSAPKISVQKLIHTPELSSGCVVYYGGPHNDIVNLVLCNGQEREYRIASRQTASVSLRTLMIRELDMYYDILLTCLPYYRVYVPDYPLRSSCIRVSTFHP